MRSASHLLQVLLPATEKVGVHDDVPRCPPANELKIDLVVDRAVVRVSWCHQVEARDDTARVTSRKLHGHSELTVLVVVIGEET